MYVFFTLFCLFLLSFWWFLWSDVGGLRRRLFSHWVFRDTTPDLSPHLPTRRAFRRVPLSACASLGKGSRWTFCPRCRHNQYAPATAMPAARARDQDFSNIL